MEIRRIRIPQPIKQKLPLILYAEGEVFSCVVAICTIFALKILAVYLLYQLELARPHHKARSSHRHGDWHGMTVCLMSLDGKKKSFLFEYGV